MKIVKIEKPGFNAEGVLENETVHVIGNWREGNAETALFTLSSFTREKIESLLEKSHEQVAFSSVKLAVPVDPLRKIICVGINYRDHAGETKNEEPQNPILFTRSLDSLVAHGASILRPNVSETFDYEGEIAVVLGRGGRHIAVEDALAHVSGYCCFMDGSVREYQKHALTTGKNFFQSGSMGPWVVTADEVGTTDLKLETRLNGQTVQSAHLSDLIFGIAQIIAYCSRWTVLKPGDVIATGTPGGVGSRRIPPLWMKPGDEIVVEVEKLGCLRNPIAGET
jgi:2-keto-4-pentenoate hydratase/2-oxohepta-3-ene-1,7-dioic acid hydratase in catechol pathway